jgi:hypothetical protein
LRPSNKVIANHYTMAGSIRGAARTLGYAESALRKWAKSDPDIATIFGTNVEESPTALASKAAEIRDLRGKVKKLSEALGQRDEHLEQIVEAARLPVTRPSYREAIVHDDDHGLPKRSIILPIFDIQYGQHVHQEDVAFGRGGFSEEVFDTRLAMYVRKVKAFLSDRATATNFTELHIPLGGDLVEGDQIYPGMAWQLEKDPIRQVLDIRTKLSTALREIIRFAKEELGVESIAIYAVPGNHGKVGGKRSGAIPATYSWDYLAAVLILDDLREEPIDLKVNAPGGAILFSSLGHKFLTIHGDEIKGVMGIPFYGLAKADGRFIRMSEIVHDYLLMGHHHQPANIPNGSGGATIVSGDWVGPNNLSRQIMAGSRPQQSVLLISSKHGLVEEAHIYLDGEDRSNRETPPLYSVAS